LRSLLFTPGNKPEMMTKSLNGEADAVILDLEDSVPDNQKEAARSEVIKLIKLNIQKDVYIRVNGLSTPWIIEDIIQLCHYSLKGFVVPKVTCAADVEKIDWLVNSSINESATKALDFRIIAIIETAEGVLNAQKIAQARSPHLEGIMFGAIDYSLDIKGSSEDGFSMLFPRAQVVTACRSRGLLPIDSVYPNFKDQEGLERESQSSKAMGFAGKACIHPAQVEVTNRVFSPSSADITWAKRILESYEKAVSEGRGAVNVDGYMVDLPVAQRARNILSLVSR